MPICDIMNAAGRGKPAKQAKGNQMKTCANCSREIDTKDGENLCETCDRYNDSVKKDRKKLRKAHEDALKSLGLVKVRGALGGVYWE